MPQQICTYFPNGMISLSNYKLYFANVTNTCSYIQPYNTRNFGQSFEEKAGTSSYQPSDNVFSKNNSDNDLFILHLIIQVIQKLHVVM